MKLLGQKTVRQTSTSLHHVFASSVSEKEKAKNEMTLSSRGWLDVEAWAVFRNTGPLTVAHPWIDVGAPLYRAAKSAAPDR